MLKNMKLASKLALAIGIFLAAIFAVLIIVTAVLSGGAITKAIFGELTAIATSNSHQVQQIFDVTGKAAGNGSPFFCGSGRNVPERNLQCGSNTAQL